MLLKVRLKIGKKWLVLIRSNGIDVESNQVCRIFVFTDQYMGT